MDVLRIFLDGANRNRTLFVLLAGFALFPIYTGIADLPFWNDLAMRIMLLIMSFWGLCGFYLVFSIFGSWPQVNAAAGAEYLEAPD